MMRAGLIAMLLLMIVRAVSAQNPTDLIPGARIRYEFEGRTVIAGVNAVRGDSAVLLLWQQPGTANVSLSLLGPIDVSRGAESRWSSALRWGWRSALVFAALGALVAEPGECEGCGRLETTAVMGASGFVVGAGFGVFAPRERWIRVRGL